MRKWLSCPSIIVKLKCKILFTFCVRKFTLQWYRSYSILHICPFFRREQNLQKQHLIKPLCGYFLWQSLTDLFNSYFSWERSVSLCSVLPTEEHSLSASPHNAQPFAFSAVSPSATVNKKAELTSSTQKMDDSEATTFQSCYFNLCHLHSTLCLCHISSFSPGSVCSVSHAYSLLVLPAQVTATQVCLVTHFTPLF